MGNLRNPYQHANSAWDWSFLNGCWAPTKIKVSDLDGIVERHGQFVAIETKAPGEELEQGQAILFEQLRKQPNWKFVALRGTNSNPQEMKLFQNGRWSDWLPTDIPKVQEMFSLWFKRANGAR